MSNMTLDALCALATLDPREREIFVDRVLFGWSWAKLGVEHGLSYEQVRTLGHQAERKLAKAVAA